MSSKLFYLYFFQWDLLLEKSVRVFQFLITYLVIYCFCHFSQYLFCMSGSLYISPFFQNFSTRIKEKCRTNHSDIDLSIVFLLTDHSEFVMEGFILIRYQLDAKIVLVAEFRVWILRIFGYSDDLDSKRFEFSLEPSEIRCLQGTTRCIIFRIKIEESQRRWWDETIEEGSHREEGKGIVFF